MIPDFGPGLHRQLTGALRPSGLASHTPDPLGRRPALSTLSSSIGTYERVWQADGGLNQVQDLLVRFPNETGAQEFLLAAEHALESGEIVDSNTVSSIPGARRVTYFAATDQAGVGEAITIRAGVYVGLLSFFSAASGSAQPISPAKADKAARTQYAAMVQAPGGTSARTEGRHQHEGRLGRHPRPGRVRGAGPGPGRGDARLAATARGRRGGGGPAGPTRPLRRQTATRLTISANTAGDVTGSRCPESTRMTSTGAGRRSAISSCISGRTGRSRSFIT